MKHLSPLHLLCALCLFVLINWGVWHFSPPWRPWYQYVIPIASLPQLAIPWVFGSIAWSKLKNKRLSSSGANSKFIDRSALAILFLSYLSTFYGTGSLLGLIPEFYKFGGTKASLSRSTIYYYFTFALTGMALCIVVVRYQSSTSKAYERMSRSFGMLLGGAASLIGIIFTGHVHYRP
jgi:hypothetical protein